MKRVIPPDTKIILDACVLYSAPVRDLLLNMADQEMFQPKWSEIIQDEWIRNLLSKRPDLDRTKLERTSIVMNEAFPDADVKSFESLINLIELPDPGDRHVVAAAIVYKASIIVTFNIKDFPNDYLEQYDLRVEHPDVFISNLYLSNTVAAKVAFTNQLDSLRNPPKTKDELLATLEKCNLKESAGLFRG